MDDRADNDAVAASTPRVSLAAVALEGRAIRYSEVEKPNGEPLRLRRLGTADFDFDVAEAVLGIKGPAHLDTVLEAVGQVLNGTVARSLKVLVHPSKLVSFFSPLPDALSASERHEQLRQEAALLADVNTAEPVRIRAVPLRSETVTIGEEDVEHRWHHVYHVPEPVHARLTLVARTLNLGAYDLVDSTRAAAEVVRTLDSMAPVPSDVDPEKPISLALGAYGDSIEMAVLKNGLWFHSHHAPIGSSDDAAYFAVALLERLNLPVSSVGRLVMYGDDANIEEFGLLSSLLDVTPTLVNPLEIFGRTPEGAPPELLASYVPSIGAVL